MSGMKGAADRTRATALGTLIALSLVLLAGALTLGDPSGGGVSIRAVTAAFIVTSSRDAGPETLRDAILAADRLSSRARIVVTVNRITIESALPPLINPRGVDIEAPTGAGIIDADHQTTGATLQINSPASTLKGLHIVNAHASGIIVNAPGVQLDSLTMADSKVGVLLHATARGATIRTSIFERNETAVMAEAGVRDVTIGSSIFRGNTRAGFWSVGAVEPGISPASARKYRPDEERVRVIGGVFERNAAGVVANQPTLVQKSRFIGNREFAVLILGGSARVEDSEIRDSVGNAISVTSGQSVVLTHNTLIDNLSTAIMVRDSAVTIERNTLQHNGYGIVSMISDESLAPVIRDNVITRTTADAITVIGGTSLLQRNQIVENHGAGLRVLDLSQVSGTLKASPRLDANVFRGNGIDMPPNGVYLLSGVR